MGLAEDAASTSEANGADGDEEGREWVREMLAGLRRTARWGMNAAMLSRGEWEAGVRAGGGKWG